MTIVTTPEPRASSVLLQDPFDLVHRVEVNSAVRGEVMSIDPDALASINVHHLLPIRSTRSHVGAPNFSGKHFHSALRCHVWFESRLEQQFVQLTECDDTIDAIVAQPMKLWWTDAHHESHVPDYLVRHRDGRIRIVNVRPARRVAASETAFALVDAFAASVGVDAEVFSGLDPQTAAQLSFLHPYRLLPSQPIVAFDEPFTPRWVYEQHDARLVRDMWIAVAHGTVRSAGGGVIDDDTILIADRSER